MFRKFIRDYLRFNRFERNGAIALVILMIIIAALPAMVKKLSPVSPVDFSKINAILDSLEANETRLNDSIEASISSLEFSPSHTVANAVLFAFDPNTISKQEWIQLGLPEKTAQIIINYRNKGGRFKEKSDLKRIYGLSSSDYERLEPFITIESEEMTKTESAQNGEITKSKEAPYISPLVELNTADSIQLEKLPGIGPVLAARILKFRNKLGGFYSIRQLLDVYGLSPETYSLIENRIQADSSLIRLLSINFITADSLARHPYAAKSAASIVNFRIQHGHFKSWHELKVVDALPPEQLEKLRHYLSF
jgi:DNA uptake protein ComE-like DNA-binding protein